MNLLLTIAAVTVIIVALVSSRPQPPTVEPTPQTPTTKQKELEEPESTPAGERAQPTLSPKPTPSSTPAEEQRSQQPSVYLSTFRYPNATVVRESVSTMFLESQDSSETITDWYKEKIKAVGASAKSFVQTKTNDNVLNNLVGATQNEEIRVEIRKTAGEQLVKITITLISKQ